MGQHADLNRVQRFLAKFGPDIKKAYSMEGPLEIELQTVSEESYTVMFGIVVKDKAGDRRVFLDPENIFYHPDEDPEEIILQLSEQLQILEEEARERMKKADLI